MHHREIAANNAEHAVQVDTTLGDNQQHAIQWHSTKGLAKFQISHFGKRSKRRHRTDHIKNNFTPRNLQRCQCMILRNFAEHVEHDQGDYCQHDD